MNEWYSVDPLTLHVVLSAVLPIVTGFFQRSTWSDRVKANVAIVVGAVANFLANAMNEDGYANFDNKAVVLMIVGVVISIASYNGYYKKTIDPNRKMPNLAPRLESLDRKAA
jgi:hypothetical protein